MSISVVSPNDPRPRDGVMTMIDSGRKDHKIIAIATEDLEHNSYRDMLAHRMLMLRRFFQDYKQLERKLSKWMKSARHMMPIRSSKVRCIATAPRGVAGFAN